MPHLIAHAQRSNIRLFSAEPAQFVLDATLTLGDTSKGPRPKRFMVISGGKELSKRPAGVLELLRLHNVTLAERDHSTAREQKAFQDLIALFEAYQISYDRVHVCGFCIGKRRYKPVNANFVSHEGGRICMDCAQTELRRELSFRGFAHYNHFYALLNNCLLYTSPSPRDRQKSRMPSSA